MLFREIIEIYLEDNTKHKNKLYFDTVPGLQYVAARGFDPFL
jgi:hypothetical protein